MLAMSGYFTWICIWITCSRVQYFQFLVSSAKFFVFFLVQLRARGRATRGVRAMRLRGDDKLAAMDIVPASLMHT